MARKITQKTKTPMPCVDPAERRHTFGEVTHGYSEADAVAEATRCILCKNSPCIAGCPVEIDIPRFVRQVAEGDFDAAFHTVAEKNVLPAICGRVCPQEDQCEVCAGVRFSRWRSAARALRGRLGGRAPRQQVPASPPGRTTRPCRRIGPTFTAAAELARGVQRHAVHRLHEPGGV
jgi:glutamate synthase (NADPH/NADH) small chain